MAKIKDFYSSYKTQAQAQERRRLLEAQTGVKWDYYSQRGGFAFTAIITKETPLSDEAAGLLEPHIESHPFKAVTFTALAEISGLALADVLSAVKTLRINSPHEFISTVNRLGNFAAIRRRPAWEIKRRQ